MRSSVSSNTSKAPIRIAEDLLRLLRGSATESLATKSMVSQASNASYNFDQYISQIELNILRSANPINVTETEEITVLGQRGIWTNKSEVVGWKGNYIL